MDYDYDVFISYAREDEKAAREVRAELLKWGVKPFFDREDLLPGDDWKLAIARAIKSSRHFIALLSQASVQKEGYVQKEIRVALEVVQMLPRGRIFVIPARLDQCHPSHPELDDLNWVDLFDSFPQGVVRILRVVKPEAASRAEQLALDSIVAPRSGDGPWKSATDGALALALESDPADHVKKIRDRIMLLRQSSGVGMVAATNLMNEAHLPPGKYRQLLNAIAASPLDVAAILHAIVGVCRQQVLAGPRAITPSGVSLGAVIPLDTFARNLLTAGVAASVASARAIVHRLLARSAVLDGDIIANITFARFVSWATFDVSGGAPFPGTMSADELTCRLGMYSRLAGEPLMLLEYQLPPDVTPHVPTFCDAYARDVWDYSFRVAPANLSYGVTSPRHDCAHESGLPEIVHRPVALKHVRTMRLLR